MDMEYKKLGTPQQVVANEIRHYNWQDEIWKKRNAKWLAACVSTAGGKSVVMKSIAIRRASQGQKVIVIAPSLMIVDDLSSDPKTLIKDRQGKSIGVWLPYMVLSDGNDQDTIGSNIEAIMAFLLDRNPSQDKRILVCCYASFVQAVEKVQSKFLKNTFICVDEAHHTRVNDVDDNGDNGLGKTLKRFMECDSNSVWFFTATPYRTDQSNIFSNKRKVEKFSLKLDDMMEDIEINQWLKHIRLDILVDESYTDAVKSTWVEGRHTAIWLSNGGADMVNTKQIEFASVISAIGKELTNKPQEVSDYEWEEANGLVRFIRTASGGLEKLLDLAIDDSQRDERKAYLHKWRADRSRITVVTALMMFTEGYNWKPLDTIYVFGQKPTQAFIQIMGRGLRPDPKKDTLYIHMVLQGVNWDDKNFDNLNKYVNAIWACSLLDDYFISLNKILAKAKQGKLLKRINRLNKEIPNLDRRIQVIGEIATQLSAFKSRFKEEHDLPASNSEQREFVREQLVRKGYKEILADAILLHLKVRAVRSITGNMYANDFVAIEKSDTFDVLEQFVSNICDKNTLVAYKEYLVGNRWTTDTIVTKFKQINGDKYDYSKTVYVGMFDNIIIICPKHGEFQQSPSNHLKPQGCPMCAGVTKKTTIQFIKEAKVIHGNKYDYSKTKYDGAHKKVTIICKEHGEFEQVPISHLKGMGCSSCAGRNRTTEEFIKEAKKVHGNKYDYSKTKYKGSHTKMTFICPIHGEFKQIRNDHLKGHGCPKCLGKNKTTEEFITQAKKIHGDKYDYSKVKYINSQKKVIIICLKHGEFKQAPNKHLQNRGCERCVRRVMNSTADFIKEAKKIHGNKYDYSKVMYVNSQTKITIICKEHGEFKQIANSHILGMGCRKCSSDARKSCK
jgi:superfamily II DNA or RNA helicase